MQIWVPATRPDQVPNHDQISVKQRKRENHMGKSLLQKEKARKIVLEDRNKKDDHEEHH